MTTKTHRTEVIEEYNADGKLIRKTTTTEDETVDDSATTPYQPYQPIYDTQLYGTDPNTVTGTATAPVAHLNTTTSSN